ncbi:NUDIX hydrolase [Actinokineospora sp. UTMC 2448]|uniref:NUDIX hydrolase n=1 Tax=Actinokineospora sp. UTMC 2448 TaxID=2268449 RepID=UPI002164D29E|nr:NUDIX hydrolase [Actinokineospora sp. UTMC 2448]
MSTPKHSVSVAGIVIDEDNRVLLIQRRDNGHWEPPGGVLELNETFEQGVRREIEEETGIRANVECLTGVYKNMTRGIIALVFRCRVESGRKSSTAEAVNVEWMSLDQARSVMSPAYFVRVADAFSPRVMLREHDGVDVLESPPVI